jgi:hypothetical protein
MEGQDENLNKRVRTDDDIKEAVTVVSNDLRERKRERERE